MPSSVLARGLPLSERLPAPPGEPGSAARARLQRWRRQEPFTGEAGWQARLRADQLTEPALLSLLGEQPDALAARLGQQAWAGWIGSPMPEPHGVADLEDEPFLAPIAGNLIERARRELAGQLAQAGLSGLLDQLTEPLLWQVHGMLARTFALEVNLARMSAGQTAAEPDAHFHELLRELSTAQGQQRLLFGYPVLARQLEIAARHWLSHGALIAQRIAADGPLLARHFAGGAATGPVTGVRIGAGDRHQQGQSVAIVEWESGLRLVYKPRPLSVDVHFAALIDWVNSNGFSHPLRTPATLDRGEYGWTEFIIAMPCTQPGQIRRFYHRQGGLLALLELLRANDMHAENLIAQGEQPVLVDLETLLQPDLPLRDERLTGAQQAAARAAQTSVLQVGLLPTLTWLNAQGEGVDVSGLGRRPGQQNSLSLPALHGIGTDSVRVRMERVALDIPDHRPVGKEAELDLLDYADDIAAGYTEMHRLCREHRAQLLAGQGPLQAFAGDRVRIVIRSTMVYAMLLSTGFHPDVLRDGLERDRHFDYLWRRQALTPALGAVIAAERRDLWRNDVPYFATVTGSESLLDSDGKAVPGFPLTGALELIRESLLGWDDAHLAGQLMLIRRSLSAAAINASPIFIYPDYSLPAPVRTPSRDDLLDEAVRIGQRLEKEAFTDARSAQWLGLSSHAGRNWSAGPLGPDLFNGIAGVAIFLAQLAKLTGQRGIAGLAAKAVTTMRSQLRQELLVTGGMSGVPGMAWALCRLAVLLEDETLVAEAQELIGRLRPLAAADEQFDIVSGSAGTVVALRALHRLAPASATLDLIGAAARRLRDTARPYGPGAGWIPAVMAENDISDVPPAGLGHGNAGIAWALAEASALLGDSAYADLAADAIAYEQTLFRPQLGGWLDVRQPGDPAMVRAWCHGSVGIGLARLAARATLGGDAVDEQIEHAVADSRHHGFGLSHAPCHGDTGAIELLVVAGQTMGRPELAAEAWQWAGGLLRSISSQGWICGVPYGASTPSLMVGLAGIGYGLLRIADPAAVPSALLLDDRWGGS